MTDPGLKYAGRVSPEFRAAMDMLLNSYRVVKMIEPELRKVDEAERRAHSIGHITDPTLYKDMIYSDQFATNMKVIRAGLAFINSMDAIVKEARP